jgi:hypothetical protein
MASEWLACEQQIFGRRRIPSHWPNDPNDPDRRPGATK